MLIEGQQIGYTGWNMVVVNSMDSLVLESHNLHYLVWFILLLIGVILIFLDTLVFHNLQIRFTGCFGQWKNSEKAIIMPEHKRKESAN